LGEALQRKSPRRASVPEAYFFDFLQPEKQSFSAASSQKKAPQNAGRV
jgi:hypothetical protein